MGWELRRGTRCICFTPGACAKGMRPRRLREADAPETRPGAEHPALSRCAHSGSHVPAGLAEAKSAGDSGHGGWGAAGAWPPLSCLLTRVLAQPDLLCT